jgi:hypothetical protein
MKKMNEEWRLGREAGKKNAEEKEGEHFSCCSFIFLSLQGCLPLGSLPIFTGEARAKILPSQQPPPPM